MEVEKIAIEKLIPYAGNSRTHSEQQIEQIIASIHEFGFTNPVLIDNKNGIIAGHCRVMAAQKLGMKELPCIRLSHLTESQRKAYVIADNKLALNSGWDEKTLKSELQSIINELDINLTGFDYAELVELGMFSKDEKEEFGEFEEVSDELDGVKDLKPIDFASDLLYNIPSFIESKLGDIPEGISCWSGHDTSKESDFYFYNHRTDSTKGLDPAKTIIGFYTDDARFENCYLKPIPFASRIININPIAVVSPNFSMWAGEPKAIQIYNTFKSRWVGRFLQECGVMVIPDVNWGGGDDSQDLWTIGIPKNAPCISIQVQTASKSADEIREMRRRISFILEELTPKKLFVYGYSDKELIMKDLFPIEKMVFCNSRLQQREKTMKGGGKNGW